MPGIAPITAAGGVVYNEKGEVLLIFRRGVWDLPKGKLEENETVKECATREVAEEVGISTLPKITFSLKDSYHEYDEKGTRYGKTTHWYGMRLVSTPIDGFNPETNEGIEQVKWVSLNEAKKIVGYDNLVDILDSFEQKYH